MNDEDRDPHFGHSCLQTTEDGTLFSIFPTFNSKLFLLFSSRLSSVPLQLLVPAIRAFPGHSYGRHHWFCYDSTSLFEGQTATATGHRRNVLGFRRSTQYHVLLHLLRRLRRRARRRRQHARHHHPRGVRGPGDRFVSRVLRRSAELLIRARIRHRHFPFPRCELQRRRTGQ